MHVEGVQHAFCVRDYDTESRDTTNEASPQTGRHVDSDDSKQHSGGVRPPERIDYSPDGFGRTAVGSASRLSFVTQLI
jgi:hypothetical protein